MNDSPPHFAPLTHPLHLQYLSDPPLNSMRCFLGVIDKLDPDRRNQITSHTAFYMSEEFDPENAYKIFREKCLLLGDSKFQSIVIVGVMLWTLNELFRLGDVDSTEATKTQLVNMIEPSVETASSWIIDHIEHLPERMQRGYELYVYFCENVIPPLLKEPCKAQQYR